MRKRDAIVAVMLFMEDQSRAAIATELSSLVDDFGSSGIDSTIDAIKRRVGSREHESSYYLLQDAAGRKIAGNLPDMSIWLSASANFRTAASGRAASARPAASCAAARPTSPRGARQRIRPNSVRTIASPLRE